MHSLSLLLNVVVLIGLLIGIVRLVNKKRQVRETPPHEPEIGNLKALYGDDVIAVRKKVADHPDPAPEESHPAQEEKGQVTNNEGPLLLMYLVAKPGKQFVGYELLQALLSVGMRFGDMDIFHRHQEASGKGPVLFSLASACEKGTFDIHKMGAFSGRGLCVFMHLSGNVTIDEDRFHLMLKSAHELSEELDAKMLDGARQPLNQQSLTDYLSLIHEEEPASVAL